MGIVLSKKLYQHVQGMIGFHCPACDTMHFYYTDEYEHPGPKWEFNGDVENPTFSPSLLRSTSIPRNEAEKENPVWYPQCHLFVIDGQIQYCSDSPHALAGQTIPIPDHNRQLVGNED